MKLNKKSIIGLFLTGVLISGTVASADVLIGDGYNGAKQALKRTTKTLSKDADSFTAAFSYEIKFDGELRASESSESMYDIKAQKRLEQSTSYGHKDGESSSFWYEDSKKSISYYSRDDSYYQSNFSGNDERSVGFADPFDDDISKDAEKVIDAFVSNMKDYVQTKDTADGGKLYFGSVDSSQMPVFANALTSFVAKYTLLDEYNCENMGIPKLDGSLYCSEASGKILQNGDGLLDSIIGTASLIGTEKSGNEHTIDLTFSIKFSDINNTKVKEPDVDESKLTVYDETEDDLCYRLTDANIGTYRGNMTVRNNNSFEKLGDAQLDILSVSDDGKTADAHIVINGSDSIDSDITLKRASEDKYETNYRFEYTSADGEAQHGLVELDTYIGQYGANMFIRLNVQIEDNSDNTVFSWSNSNAPGSTILVSKIFD